MFVLFNIGLETPVCLEPNICKITDGKLVAVLLDLECKLLEEILAELLALVFACENIFEVLLEEELIDGIFSLA